MRTISKVAPDWWDYTTLDEQILNDAAKLNVRIYCNCHDRGLR